jgi:hypothetical protein
VHQPPRSSYKGSDASEMECASIVFSHGSLIMFLIQSAEPVNWTVADVQEWLESKGMAEYRENFLSKQIDGAQIIELDNRYSSPLFLGPSSIEGSSTNADASGDVDAELCWRWAWTTWCTGRSCSRTSWPCTPSTSTTTRARAKTRRAGGRRVPRTPPPTPAPCRSVVCEWRLRVFAHLLSRRCRAPVVDGRGGVPLARQPRHGRVPA